MTEVLFLTNWQQLGGAELNALLLAEGFQDHGVKTEVVFCCRRTPFVETSVPLRVLAPHKPTSLREILHFLKAVWQLRQKKPDAIFGFQNFSNVLGSLLAATIPGCKFIATQRNPAQTGGRLASIADRIVGCTALYTLNVCVSKAVKASFQDYPRWYRSRLRVIHNGTPTLAPINLSKAGCREFLKIPQDKICLGALGRLAEQKNLSFLFSVMLALPDIHLVLGGSGEKEIELKQEAEKLGLSARVSFLGDVARDDVAKFYEAIDVCVIPSRYEGFCRTLVEAMSVGLPVVASKIDVFEEVGGDAVKLFTLEASLWVEGISEILKRSEKRKELSEKARLRAVFFNKETMIAQYRNAYQNPEDFEGFP